MKAKKLISAALSLSLAATMAAGVMTTSTSALDTHKAYVVFADSQWFWGSWGYDDTASGYCANGAADITGDGTYTVYIDTTLVNTEDLGATGIDEESGDPYPVIASGVQVFCVDIKGLCATLGLTALDPTTATQDATVKVSDVHIVATMVQEDGSSEDITIDIADEDLVYGDIEGNGNFRIEFANAYGTKDANGDLINPPTEEPWTGLMFNDKLAVTFTLSGTGAEGEAADPAEDETSAPEGTSAPEESEEETSAEETSAPEESEEETSAEETSAPEESEEESSAEESKEETSAPSSTTSTPTTDNSNDNTLMIIIGVGAAVVIAMIVIIIVVLKKKN